MPEVRAVKVERLLAIGQEIPCVAGQIDVHSLGGNDVFGSVEHEVAVGFVADALDLIELCGEVAAEKVVQRIDAFVEEDVIDVRKAKDLARQRAGMGPHKAGARLRVRRLEKAAASRVADHVCRAGIRVLSVNDEADETGGGGRDARDRLLVGEALRRGVEKGYAETLGPAALRKQKGPGWRLDRRKIFGELLVSGGRAVGIDKEDI